MILFDLFVKKTKKIKMLSIIFRFFVIMLNKKYVSYDYRFFYLHNFEMENSVDTIKFKYFVKYTVE